MFVHSAMDIKKNQSRLTFFLCEKVFFNAFPLWNEVE